MERIVITIRPSPDAARLGVRDAMQQVVDAIILHEEAALGDSQAKPIDWRLERASTQSPFTVVALAESTDPTTDVALRAREIKARVALGIRDIIEHKRAPAWMGPIALDAVKNIFERQQRHAFALTVIDFDGSDTLSINDECAASGLDTIKTLRVAADVVAELPAREAYGEVEGAMIAVGRYYNRPAVQIRSHLYGFVWCHLPKELMDRFGGQHHIAEVWEGKSIAVRGRLFYVAHGKLSRIEANDVREVTTAAPIDLDSVLDPDFTSGLSPHEYLNKLHDGDLG
jgi:hypothetical protein